MENKTEVSLQGRYSAIQEDNIEFTPKLQEYLSERKSSLADKIIQNVNLVPRTLPATEGIKEKRKRPSRLEPDGISNFEACLQLSKIMLGTGILFMPHAFKMTGIWQGIVWTCIIAAMTILSYKCLIQASQHFAKINQVPSYSYGETLTLTLKQWPKLKPFAHIGKGIISTLIIISTYTVAIVYILMIAKNIQETAKWAEYNVKVRVAIIIQLPLHLCTTSVKRMHHITPMTMVAMIGLWAGYLLTTYNIGIEFNTNGIKPTEDWAAITKLPNFLSIAVFAYVGIQGVSSIENNMKHPEAFTRGCVSVSSVSVTFVAVVYGLYGLMGYLAFGKHTLGPITSQFDQNSILGNVVRIAISIGLAFSLPIVLYASFQIVNDYLSVKLANTKWAWLSRRWVQVIFITIIPLIATDIEAVLKLISIPCALLQFVIPLIMDTMIFMHTKTRVQKILFTLRNVVVAIMGVIFVVIGMYFGMKDLIDTHK